MYYTSCPLKIQAMSHPPFSFAALVRQMEPQPSAAVQALPRSPTRAKSLRTQGPISVQPGSTLNRHRYVPYPRDPRLSRPAVSPAPWSLAAKHPKTQTGPPKGMRRGGLAVKLETRLGQEILDFVSWAAPTPPEQTQRLLVVDRIQAIAQQKHPARQAKLFGSSASGLGFPHSDLDVCLFDPSVEDEKTLTKGKRASVLSKLARKLYPVSSKIQIIKHARVPILKMKDKATGLDVDIGYHSPNVWSGLETAKTLVKQHSSVKPLVMVLKLFLENRKLGETFTGGLGGMSVTLLVSRFLHLHPTFYKDRYLIAKKIDSPPQFRLGSQLVDLFHFYGLQFDYHKLGFNSKGQLISKADWQQENRSGFGPSLVLVDPNDEANNVASPSSRIQAVSSAFADAYRTLSSLSSSSTNPSPLSSIICVPKQLEETRQRLKSLRERVKS